MKLRTLTYSLILLLAIVIVGACQPQSGSDSSATRKKILVVHEMHAAEQEGKSLAKAFREELSDTARYELEFCYGAYAAFERAHHKVYYDTQKDRILSRFGAYEKVGYEPDLVILLDDLMAQSAIDCSDHPWLSQKPVLCLNVMYPEWRGRLEKMSNFVVMESKPEPKKNIDFLRELGREPWIVTVLDSTFIDEKLRQVILEQMGNDTANYLTNLQFESVNSLRHPRSYKSTLIPLNLQYAEFGTIDTTLNAQFEVTGTLRIVNNQLTFLRLKDDCYIDKSLGQNLDLYFSQTPRYFNVAKLSALNGNVGGYMTPWHEIVRQAHPVIDQLLDGIDPSAIPMMTLEKDYWMDWRLAKRIFPFAEDFPQKVKFVNLPWEKRSRLNGLIHDYWKQVLVALLAIVAIILPSVLTLRSHIQYKRLLKQGRKALNDARQTESILAATRSYHWELIDENTVRIGPEFSKLMGTELSELPVQAMFDPLIEGKEEMRAALYDTSKKMHVVEMVAQPPTMNEPHAFNVYVNHILDESGKMRCVGFTVFNDEAYEAEKIRQEAYHMSEEINTKESFLAAMSHEIRSPLNAIVGFSDVLVKQHSLLTEDERTTYAGYINDSKEQLLRLLDEVMNYSERKGERLRFELSRKGVERLMNEVYFTHTVIVPKHLELRYRPVEDVMVMTNRSAVLQIMSNFMNNAIKFTTQGSITLGWETMTDSQGESVELYVQDTGPGISEEDQKLIFEKYYKTDSHTTGAGIGLALCMQLAETMNGSIEIKSQLGVGSRFALRLKVISHPMSQETDGPSRT